MFVDIINALGLSTLILISILLVAIFFGFKLIVKAKRQLKISNSKYRLIFNHSPLGIIYFDRKGIILECNSEFVKIIGSSREKLIGLDMKQLPNQKLQSILQDVFNGKTGVYNDLYSSFTAKKETFIKGTFAPIILNGKMSGGIAVIEDVTKQKEYEKELIDAKIMAISENTAKSLFLANMSHEVRTPLNGILGILQILDRTTADLNQKELIDMALKSGNRLTRLLSNILDMANLQSNNIMLHEEEFSIAEIIKSAVRDIEKECAAKNVTVSFYISNTVPEKIKGDNMRIRQILENIAWNSYKFTEKGNIEIKAEFTKISDSLGKLIISVKDTGIGIEPQKLEEIKKPFTQSEQTYSKRFQGAGLVLAIVQRVLEVMDGTIRISSQTGIGTEVTFEIPVGYVISCPVGIKSAKVTIPPLKILVADDDRINSLMFKRLLEKMNHSVAIAYDGKEAIDKILSSNYDIVFMDIQMPVMNGIEALQNIRNLQSYNNLKVVAVTAYAMSGDREKFLEAGFNGYIPKPIDSEAIEETLIALTISENAIN